jgi:hypothetical protein
LAAKKISAFATAGDTATATPRIDVHIHFMAITSKGCADHDSLSAEESIKM